MNTGAVLWLKVCTALEGDPGSIYNTFIGAHNHFQLSSREIDALFCLLQVADIYVLHIYACGNSDIKYKINICINIKLTLIFNKIGSGM